MGRAENRKIQKNLKKGLTSGQFEELKSKANKDIVQMEVNKQIEFYQNLWTECIIEAFKKNRYSTDKAKMILDDVELIMIRKAAEKRNEQS